MLIALAVFTDGRYDLLAETLEAAERNLAGIDGPRFIFDDTGLVASGPKLRGIAGPKYRIVQWERRRGFGGTIAGAWKVLDGLLDTDARTPVTHVFHLEDDFIIKRPVDAKRMARALDRRPKLAQMALRRQACNPKERTAGGVVEQHPHEYEEKTDWSDVWLEHRMFFTTNPSVYPIGLCALGWPECDESEGVMTRRLRDDGYRFGYWGGLEAGRDWVEHIGEQRVGTGY